MPKYLLRPFFVEHNGKKELVVEADELVLTSRHVNFAEMTAKMADEINFYLPTETMTSGMI